MLAGWRWSGCIAFSNNALFSADADGAVYESIGT